MDFFNSSFMLQTPPHHDAQNRPILSASCTPQEFHGAAHSLLGKRVPSMSPVNTDLDAYEDHHHHHHHHHMNNPGDDDLSDDGTQLGEKKRRLNIEQVRALEKSFELHNKLEPERKMQLAKTLGLQPRQIAIWFQNRRARWKTKQLERDYESLKRQLDAVKAENDALQSQNQKLHAEIMALKTRELPTESINLNKDTEGSCSNRSENSSEIIKLDISTAHQAAIDDSPRLSAHATNIADKSAFFQNSSAMIKPNMNNGGMVHLFQMNNNGVVSSRPEISCPKNMDHVSVKEESSLSNIFCNGMEDHPGFWPWLEQHNFN